METNNQINLLQSINNYFCIDPNKVTDRDGNVINRYVKHENLVMYANLKARVKNRSVTVGGDTIVNYNFRKNNIKSLNILKPTEKDYFSTSWVDTINNERDTSESFGIEKIKIKQTPSLIPQVVIEFTDPRGDGLFNREINNSQDEKASPYSAFFQMPYPIFELDVKGYYGKAVKFLLNLLNFNSSFDETTNNYKITAEFVGHTYALLADMNMYYGIVAPYMFKIDNDNFSFLGEKYLDEVYSEQINSLRSKISNEDSERNDYINNKIREIEQLKVNGRWLTIVDLITLSQRIESFFNRETNLSQDITNILSEITDYVTELSNLENSTLKIKNLNFDEIDNSENFDFLDYEVSVFNSYYKIKDFTIVNEDNKLLYRDIIRDDSFNRDILTRTSTNTIDVSGVLQEINRLKEEIRKFKQTKDNFIDEIISQDVIEFIGFKPTIENVFRVMLNCFETFFKLMITTTEYAIDSRANIDNLVPADNFLTNELLYPWFTYYKNKEDLGNVLAYPSDVRLNKPNGFNSTFIPEIDFVEEFIRAQTRVDSQIIDSQNFNEDIINNDQNIVATNPISSIQYPFEGDISPKYLNDNITEDYRDIISSALIVYSAYGNNPFSINEQNAGTTPNAVSNNTKFYQLLGKIDAINFINNINNTNSNRNIINFINNFVTNAPNLDTNTFIRSYLDYYLDVSNTLGFNENIGSINPGLRLIDKELVDEDNETEKYYQDDSNLQVIVLDPKRYYNSLNSIINTKFTHPLNLRTTRNGDTFERFNDGVINYNFNENGFLYHEYSDYIGQNFYGNTTNNIKKLLESNIMTPYITSADTDSFLYAYYFLNSIDVRPRFQNEIKYSSIGIVNKYQVLRDGALFYYDELLGNQNNSGITINRQIFNYESLISTEPLNPDTVDAILNTFNLNSNNSNASQFKVYEDLKGPNISFFIRDYVNNSDFYIGNLINLGENRYKLDKSLIIDNPFNDSFDITSISFTSELKNGILPKSDSEYIQGNLKILDPINDINRFLFDNGGQFTLESDDSLFYDFSEDLTDSYIDFAKQQFILFARSEFNTIINNLIILNISEDELKKNISTDGTSNIDFYNTLSDRLTENLSNFVNNIIYKESFIYRFTQKTPIDIFNSLSSETNVIKLTSINNYLYGFITELRQSRGELVENIPSDVLADRNSVLSNEDIKLQLYNTFKNIHDKWIVPLSEEEINQTSKNSRVNFSYVYQSQTLNGDLSISDRTLFDHFYFLDRANRNIGDKALVDIKIFNSLSDGTNLKAGLFGFISEILSKGGWVFHPLTNYINFYGNNQEDISSIFEETPFIDFNESSPSFVCQYVGGYSTHLDLSSKVNTENGFKNDGFDTRVESLPLDFTSASNSSFNFNSNQVVSFAVDVGIENQNIFKSVGFNQKEFRETSESLIAISQLVDRDNNKNVQPLSSNIFNLYSRRSYTARVLSMGCLNIQPTMYFFLRNIPMYSGHYLIIDVEHDITANNITTNFTGNRVPLFRLPLVEDVVANIRTEFVKGISDGFLNGTYNDNSVNNLSQYNSNKDTKGLKSYNELPLRTNIPFTTITKQNFANSLLKLANNYSNIVLTYTMSIALIEQTLNKTELRFPNNNPFGLQSDVGLQRSFNNLPAYNFYANDDESRKRFLGFNTLDDGILFATENVKRRLDRYAKSNNLDSGEAFAEFWQRTYNLLIDSDAEWSLFVETNGKLIRTGKVKVDRTANGGWSARRNNLISLYNDAKVFLNF